jgi:hypothetical protein
MCTGGMETLIRFNHKNPVWMCAGTPRIQGAHQAVRSEFPLIKHSVVILFFEKKHQVAADLHFILINAAKPWVVKNGSADTSSLLKEQLMMLSVPFVIN